MKDLYLLCSFFLLLNDKTNSPMFKTMKWPPEHAWMFELISDYKNAIQNQEIPYIPTKWIL